MMQTRRLVAEGKGRGYEGMASTVGRRRAKARTGLALLLRLLRNSSSSDQNSQGGDE